METGVETVSRVLPETAATVAVTVDVPAATPLAEPAGDVLKVATWVFDEAHTAVGSALVDPSEK